MLTSIKNPKIQLVRALLSRRSEREAAGLFVVEGVRLAEEALAGGWRARLVLTGPQLSERGRKVAVGFAAQGAELIETADHVLAALTDTETPQGILAVIEHQPLPLNPQSTFVLIADGVRDPGNLGTLLRTAAAAGVQAALLAPGTTDAFAPKVLRAGMGAHFRLPIWNYDWAEISTFCQKTLQPPLRIALTAAQNGIPLWQADLGAPLAVVVGGEAEGYSPSAAAVADLTLTIPMPGKSESLNAAVAAAIILFDVVRQRTLS
ncbi:MAG TPA: RNA methyltransferase [Anaerolineaceae bacterium]|jgi:TrmH family RNA methyltransferase|nr:RNA methyltransferase [Anaerolineaceae bacterium]